MLAMMRCRIFSSSSAGNAGSRSSSASVETIIGRSRLSDRPLTETVNVFEDRPTRAPADSISSAISSLLRRRVPLPSMLAVMLARESLPAGLKYSPERIEPAIETVGLAGFSSTSNVIPFESWNRRVRATKDLLLIDFTNAFFLLGYEPSDGAIVFGKIGCHDALDVRGRDLFDHFRQIDEHLPVGHRFGLGEHSGHAHRAVAQINHLSGDQILRLLQLFFGHVLGLHLLDHFQPDAFGVSMRHPRTERDMKHEQSGVDELKSLRAHFHGHLRLDQRLVKTRRDSRRQQGVEHAQGGGVGMCGLGNVPADVYQSELSHAPEREANLALLRRLDRVHRRDWGGRWRDRAEMFAHQIERRSLIEVTDDDGRRVVRVIEGVVEGLQPRGRYAFDI